jgi:hypothetical protein
MPSLDFLLVGKAKLYCGGFVSGALQCKTTPLTILAELQHLGTEAS